MGSLLLADLLFVGQPSAGGVQVVPGSLDNNGLECGVTVDPAGDVYFTNFSTGTVSEITAGAATAKLVATLQGPAMVASDTAGNVYVADYNAGDVTEITTVGTTTTVATGLNGPYAIAVDGWGNVYVTERGADDLVEIPAGGGPRRVLGSHLGLAGTYQGAVAYTGGIAVDSTGNVYVAATSNGDVVEIPAGGGTPVVVATQLTDPSGLALDATGDLYVAEPDIGIVEFHPGGGAGNPTPVESAGALGSIFELAVVSPPPTFTADSPAGATAGAAYTYRFAATSPAGEPPATFRLATGALPPGLVLDPLTGTLSGTPSAPGTYRFRVEAANAAQGVLSPELIVGVSAAPAPPQPTPTLTVGDDATVASGSPTVTLGATVTSGGAPVPAGSVTFVLAGPGGPVGPSVSVPVAAGRASTSYPLPTSLTPGRYAIDVSFGPPPGFAPSTDSSHALTVTAPPTRVGSGQGYWLAAADGGVFGFGSRAFYGSAAGLHLHAPIVAITATPDGHGYWLTAADGGVFAYGDARFLGNASPDAPGPVVAAATTPDGDGYWLVSADGRIATFGDAVDYGSAAGLHLHAPIVAITATPDGHGYWLTAADGGVFAYGDARFLGNASPDAPGPVVAAATTPDGDGYWLVSADGRIATFGDAVDYGSAAGLHLHAPIVAITATPDGHGYWLTAADGGVFAYGDATFGGSAADLPLAAPVVSEAG